MIANKTQSTNDVFTVIKRTGKNTYDVLSSSFYSTGDWNNSHRFTGTKNQCNKFTSWTGLKIN